MPDAKIYASSFACERVLRDYENDKILSAIRMLDVFIFAVPENIPANEQASAVMESLMLTLFKCEVPVTFTVKLVCIDPNGDPIAQSGTETYRISLLGGASGHQLISPLRITASHAGVYWMEVYADDQVVSRIPLEARFEKMQTTLSESASKSDSASQP